MRKFLCKIFRFLLDLVGQVVDLVANTLIKVGTAAVEVLSEVAGAVGSAITKNPLVMGALLVGGFFLLRPMLMGDDEEKKPLLANTVKEISV